MADPPAWDQLGQLARAALRWASAMALIRGTADAQPDAFDLLAGIILAQRPTSEAQVLLEHFQIPPGAVFAHAGARPCDPAALLARFRTLPAGSSPPLGPEVQRILDHTASAIPNPDPDGGVSLRMLFGGLLESTTPASRALREELAARGVDADAVMASYRDFLAEERRGYADFLRERHPYRPPRVKVPTLQADQAEGADLVGIEAEVDAFASLIASRALTPPLAVGLFGDWGSGKSFFLRSLQRSIDTLVRNPAAEPSFYRHIAQVEFNAWQYVGGDLWASLLEHLFRNLRTSPDEPDSVVVARQKELIAQIRASRIDRDERKDELDQLAADQKAAEAEVQRRKAERKASLADLQEQLRTRPLEGWRPSETLRKAVEDAAARAGLTRDIVEDADDLRASIDEARLALKRASPLIQPLREGGWRYAAAVAGVVLLSMLVGLALARLDAGLGALASVLSAAAGYVRLGARWIQTGLDQLAEARRQIDAATNEERGRLDNAVAAAERRLAVADQRLAEAQAAQRRLDAQAADLERQLEETTASRMLAEFVAERTGSDDYRKRLGVQALVRQDLQRLSELVAGTGGETDAGHGTAHPVDHPINRIVLYIDDLDRCPTGLVIEVLQAVHLLLAFPLFVVVVAVDSRWLEGALRDHYHELLDATAPDHASPADYLEKIFQVPFWVQPLAPYVRMRMARKLLEPSLEPPAAPTSGADHTEGEPGPGQEPASQEPVGREFFDLVEALGRTDGAAAPWQEAARLTVTVDELACIDQVASLLGDTPRSVKRFVNVYQLTKAIGLRRRLPLDEPTSPPASARVILLLAVSTAFPDLAGALAAAAEAHCEETLPLGKALTDLPEPGPEGHDVLRAWIAARPGWDGVDLVPLLPWMCLARRFTFRHGATHPDTCAS
jgi:hypothetical protein